MAISEAELLKLVSSISQVPPEKIARESRFTVELRMDSLASLDLLAALEEDHGITISQADARQIQTFGQLVDRVTRANPA
jgi:acyl carrier protein